MSNTAYTQRANGEEKRKKSRNVFYFGISLYKPGVWARTNALLSGKPMMGRLGDLATPKQGHDLYPMGTAKGFHLVFFHVLTSGTGGKGEYLRICLYSLMRCVWKRTF